MYSIKYFKIHPDKSKPFLSLQAGEEITVSYQTALPGFDDGPHSSIKSVGLSQNKEYYKYIIRHEEERKICGRYRNEPISSYISVEQLELFRSSDNTHILVKGCTGQVKCALTRLYEHGDIKTFDYSVNMTRLKNEAEGIIAAGGWFGKLKIDHLKSAALFGPYASDSEVWRSFEDKGTMSALLFQVYFAGSPFSIMMSANGNMLVYDNWDEEQSLSKIRAVAEAFQGYLDFGEL